MSNSFESSMWGIPPVYREALGSGSDNHPHEFMGVSLREPNRFVEDLDLAIFIDSPYKPDLAPTEGQRVSPEDLLGQIAQRGLEQSALSLTDQPSFEVSIVGLLKGLGMLAKVPQRAESIALPDLLLPKPIVALDQGIGGGPSRWGKDRNDPAGQTEPNQLPQTSRMHPTSSQTHIVVHLQESRDTMELPIPCKKGQNTLDPSVGLLGSKDQASDHVLAVQDHQGALRSEVMSYNKVDLMDVVLSSGHRAGQDWPLSRPVPTLAGHKPVTMKDPMDRADAVQGTDCQIDQLVVDCLRSIEPQRVSCAFEPAMDSDDQSFEGVAHPASHPVGSAGLIQKPALHAAAIPTYPFVNPLPTSSEPLGNPTDRFLLQPQTNALFPFCDQRRSFFDSYYLPSSLFGSEGIVLSLSTMCCQFVCKRCVVM